MVDNPEDKCHQIPYGKKPKATIDTNRERPENYFKDKRSLDQLVLGDTLGACARMTAEALTAAAGASSSSAPLPAALQSAAPAAPQPAAPQPAAAASGMACALQPVSKRD